MTKPVIVTRTSKGAPLTRTELDNNFSNIDNATIGVSDGTNSGTLDLNDTLNFTASGNATVVYNSSTKTLTVGTSGGGSSALSSLSDTDIQSPTTFQGLAYSTALGKWINTDMVKLVTGTSGRINVDSSIVRAPIIDLATVSGLTAGTYTTANVTVDAYGRVTSIANGSSSGPQMFIWEAAGFDFYQSSSSNNRWLLNPFQSGSPRVNYDPNNLVTRNVDGVNGRFQINSAGTYLIETFGQIVIQGQVAFGFYDVTANTDIFTMYDGYAHLIDDSSQNRWMIPNITKVVTITSANKYEWYASAGNSNWYPAGMGTLFITKLA
jgi:hypothetical protein